MMRATSWIGSISALYLVASLAGCASQPPKFVAAKYRAPEITRDAIVVVPQAEIQPLVAAATGGMAFGLIGAIVDTSVTQHRTKAAEEAITPLRNALTDYNFDQEAIGASKDAFAKIDWLAIGSTQFTKDGSSPAVSALMDKSQAAQILLVSYDYELTPDFSGLRVGARYSLLPRAGPSGGRPEDRIKLKNALYTRILSYQVPLPKSGKDLNENCNAWSADGGARARRALSIGIVKLNAMFARNMTLTSPDAPPAEGVTTLLLEDDGAGKLSADRVGNWSYVANAGAE